MGEFNWGAWCNNSGEDLALGTECSSFPPERSTCCEIYARMFVCVCVGGGCQECERNVNGPTMELTSVHVRLWAEAGEAKPEVQGDSSEEERRKGEPQIQKERQRRRDSGSEVRKERKGGRELFIAVNVHKDCSEGYPTKKGQQRQVYLIWIKGWRQKRIHAREVPWLWSRGKREGDDCRRTGYFWDRIFAFSNYYLKVPPRLLWTLVSD